MTTICQLNVSHVLQFALKVVQLLGKHPKEIEMTIQEVELLSQFKHPYILQYTEAVFQGGKIMIFTGTLRFSFFLIAQ